MLVTYPEAAHWPVDPTRLDLVRSSAAAARPPWRGAAEAASSHALGRRFRNRPAAMCWSSRARQGMVLGRLPRQRGKPIELMRNRVFTSIAEAEWEVFKLRWEALTGPPLPPHLRNAGMTDTTSVLGYAWPMVVSPGEEIAFHLSSATFASAEAAGARALRRSRSRRPRPAPQKCRPPVNGTVGWSHQPIRPGSCAIVADAPALSASSPSPSARSSGRRCPASARRRSCRAGVPTQEGWRLGLDEKGRLEFVLAAGGRRWRIATAAAAVVARMGADGGCLGCRRRTDRVMVRSADAQAGRDRARSWRPRGRRGCGWPAATPLVDGRACRGRRRRLLRGYYDGKIDRPRLYAQRRPSTGCTGFAKPRTYPMTDARSSRRGFLARDGDGIVTDLSAHTSTAGCVRCRRAR